MKKDSAERLSDLRIGWVGTGRMGLVLASRLLAAGCDLAVYNRTRSKADPLEALGAQIVDSPRQLADREVVFTIVAASGDLIEVITGSDGLLSGSGATPDVIVDFTTVSAESSQIVRKAAEEYGSAFLAAPVSGNPKVVKAGKLSVVVSGSEAAFQKVLPWLNRLAGGVSYVGEGEAARIVKICHNVFLGVLTQSLAEVTMLAQRAGVPRHAFLDFMNKSVLGSTFTRYKTPAFVNLDFTPTFTPPLLRKDLDLGLDAARQLEVPMAVAALVREIVQGMIGQGFTECDFAALLEVQARLCGQQLRSEEVAVSDGLSAAEETLSGGSA